ncbi:hypothetical protein [Paracoccus onubensis]|uniref:Uncharacterized protein n=1 Tax=Paracoccus onubensis TaxID=1675788 RepID=A0A418T1M5_9RHOB|nr:hypothetical protein [Paracoccus onubensis]RJE87104.1 hypothetical protein D3P04_04955 [Paracoccus onubensis]
MLVVFALTGWNSESISAQSYRDLYELTAEDQRSMEEKFSEVWDSVRTSEVFAARGGEGEGLIFVCGKIEARYKGQYVAPTWFVGALGRQDPQEPKFHLLEVSDRSQSDDMKILTFCLDKAVQKANS